MKQLILAYQTRIRLITSFLHTVDINTDVIKQYQDLGKDALTIYEEFRNQMSDEKVFKALSPIEQETVMANGRNYSQILSELQQEIQFLMNTRQPLAVQDCLGQVTAANMLFDKLVELMGGPDGKLKYPALKYVREKNWEKVKYSDKVYNLTTEIDLLIEDFSEVLNDVTLAIEGPALTALTQAIYVSLVQALAWLNSEYNRVEKEGMPKVREFKLPEIQEPKLPDEKKDQPDNSSK